MKNKSNKNSVQSSKLVFSFFFWFSDFSQRTKPFLLATDLKTHPKMYVLDKNTHQLQVFTNWKHICKSFGRIWKFVVYQAVLIISFVRKFALKQTFTSKWNRDEKKELALEALLITNMLQRAAHFTFISRPIRSTFQTCGVFVWLCQKNESQRTSFDLTRSDGSSAGFSTALARSRIGERFHN